MIHNTPSANSGQPSTIRLVYGSLSCVQTSDLISEIHRRQKTLDLEEGIEPCLLIAVTPSDLSDYWECSESGLMNTEAESISGEQWQAIRSAFERWKDCGGYTEIMETCRDAWNNAREKGGNK